MKTLNKAAVERIYERRMMATYYAHGRNDAADEARVDADAFGKHYAEMWHDVETGACSFCPSVQDAFAYYLTTVTV